MRKNRINYIDAIRGSVMILLIPYHGMNFLRRNGDVFLGLDFGIFWLHLWRMGLFFAVSGFLAAMTLALWGPSRQVRHRLMKIGIPLAVGMVTIVPLMRFIVLYFFNNRFPDHTRPAYEWTLSNIFVTTPFHLWFLSYLLALNLAVLVIWAVVRNWPTLKNAADAGFRRLAAGPWLILALALVCSSVLWLDGYVEAPNNVAHSLIPKLVPLAYYAIFFMAGWMLYRSKDLLPKVESHPFLKLFLGMGLALFAWLAVGDSIQLPEILSGWFIAFCAALAVWCTLFGVWGVFALLFVDSRPWTKYLADAAYWIYLIHMPILMVVQITLSNTSIPPYIRLVIATATSLAVALITYALLVRHTPIGRFLHGPREKRNAPLNSQSSAVSASDVPPPASKPEVEPEPSRESA